MKPDFSAKPHESREAKDSGAEQRSSRPSSIFGGSSATTVSGSSMTLCVAQEGNGGRGAQIWESAVKDGIVGEYAYPVPCDSPQLKSR